MEPVVGLVEVYVGVAGCKVQLVWNTVIDELGQCLHSIGCHLGSVAWKYILGICADSPGVYCGD